MNDFVYYGLMFLLCLAACGAGIYCAYLLVLKPLLKSEDKAAKPSEVEDDDRLLGPNLIAQAVDAHENGVSHLKETATQSGEDPDVRRQALRQKNGRKRVLHLTPRGKNRPSE